VIPLTPLLADILARIADGHTDHEIAADTNRAVETVRSHRDLGR
jgi:DNA-binding NarL/FixJ family response regulator